MAAAAGPIVVGAAVGAGVAEATGGDWKTGAMFGAVGGAVNPYSIGGQTQLASPAVVGGAVGGAVSGPVSRAAKKMTTPPPMPALAPAPRTVMAGDYAARMEAKKKLQKRRFVTAMSGGYGPLMIQREKLGT